VRGHLLIHFLVNLILPWDFLCTLGLERVRQRLAIKLPSWLGALAELEAFLCLAELADARRDLNFAELVPDLEAIRLQAQDVGHPLIPGGIKNSIQLDESVRLYLITGSNMSGKSTFLRTLGLNLLLAKAGAPVLATRFRFQNRDLFTLLRVADLLENQISSFYAEVKELKNILDASRERPIFYLIDEIFRGTNNRERLAGSRAYLHAIAGTRASGLVATHDLELTALSEAVASLRNYHFRESFEEGKMTFSYLLREGPCPSTNALKIMEREGLPV
jgi:DNA mismatch repair ATPase MutS